MKPHLPLGLRTALLAAVALVSSATTQAAPAEYGGLYVTEKHATIVCTEWDSVNNIVHESSLFHPLQDANSQSWVLTINASDLAPESGPDDEFRETATSRILSRGFVEVTTTNHTKWEMETGDQDGTFAGFNLLVAPDGNLVIVLDNKEDESKTIHLTKFAKDWKWEHIENVTIHLAYNADTGTLSLASGTIQREEGGKITTIKPIDDLDYAMPEKFFSAGEYGDYTNSLAFINGMGASLESSLLMQGTEQGWRITGLASIQDMKNGAYGGTFDSTQKVQYLGGDGIIYTTEDVVFSNTVETALNPENLASNIAMGFGAAAGTTLTVTTATNAINDTNGQALVPTLNIVGNGTVKLQYDAANSGNLSNVSVNIADSATLEINCDDAGQIDLSKGTFSKNASIVKTGDATNGSWLMINTGDKSTTLKNLANEDGTLEISGTGKLNATLLQGKSVEIEGKTTVQSTDISAGTDGVSIGSTASVTVTNNLTSEGAVATAGSLNVGQTLTASSVTATGSGSIKAAEIQADAVTAAGVTITNGVAGASALTGKVSVGTSGISANAIQQSSTIAFTSASTGSVSTASLTDSDIKVGSNVIVDNATTSSSISIKKDSLAATGQLTANSINLQGTYNLTAKAIGTSSIVDGATQLSAVTADNVNIYTAKDGKRVLAASTINADNVIIGSNAVLSGANVSANDKITIKDGGNVENTTITDGQFLTEGVVSLENVTIVNKADSTGFGGAAGTVATIVNGVESVEVSGTLADESLSISKLTVNGENLAFDVEKEEKTYIVLEGTGDQLKYDYNAMRDQINIESYVRAKLEMDPNGNIQIVGTKDTVGIKQELSNTSNRGTAMKALDDALASSQTDTDSPLAAINEYVGHVNRYSATDRQNVLSAASGASAAVLADSQRRGLRDVQSNLRNRIIQMGGGTNAGLTTDWQYAGIQAWAQADSGSATTKGSGDEWGYDYDTKGATAGINLDLTANLVTGLSFSTSYGELSVDSTDHAQGDHDAQYVSFFARHQKERWVQMFIFTYGMNEINMERSVLGYTGKGDTKGYSFSAYYELGYTLGLNYDYTHIIQPLASISFTSATINSYDEEGSIGNAGLAYSKHNFTYGQVALGARYQGVLYQTVHERNAVVEARALITMDFGDATNEAEVAYLADGKTFKVNGTDSSGTGYQLGVGVSIPVEQHTTLYADADYTTAPDYTGFRGNIGVRYDF